MAKGPFDSGFDIVRKPSGRTASFVCVTCKIATTTFGFFVADPWLRVEEPEHISTCDRCGGPMEQVTAAELKAYRILAEREE